LPAKGGGTGGGGTADVVVNGSGVNGAQPPQPHLDDNASVHRKMLALMALDGGGGGGRGAEPQVRRNLGGAACDRVATWSACIVLGRQAGRARLAGRLGVARGRGIPGRL
jgi:hypothetical protein